MWASPGSDRAGNPGMAVADFAAWRTAALASAPAHQGKAAVRNTERPCRGYSTARTPASQQQFSPPSSYYIRRIARSAGFPWAEGDLRILARPSILCCIRCCVPGRSDWITQCGIVITDIPHFGADLPGSHFLRRQRAEEIDRRTCRIRGSEPALVVVWRQDHRHTVVNGGGKFVGFGGENGIGLERLAAGFVLPALPQTSEGEDRAVTKANGPRLPIFRVQLLPFVEAVSRDETSPIPQSFAKYSAGTYRLRFSV